MTRVWKPWVWCGLALVLISSCALKRAELALDTKAVGAPTIIAMVKAQERKIASLIGSGIVSFESEEVAGSAAFEISMRKPDSLLITFEGPFGIDVGTLFLSRQRYVMYNSLENLAVTGTPSSSTIRSVIPFELTFEQIVSAFSGVLAIPFDQEALLSYEVDDHRFLLTFACGEHICKYWVDAAYLLVARYEVVDSENRVLLDGRFSSFREEDDVTAPRRISITFPEQQRRVSVSYSNLRLNPDNPSFAFSIPSNAHVIVK